MVRSNYKLFNLNQRLKIELFLKLTIIVEKYYPGSFLNFNMGVNYLMHVGVFRMLNPYYKQVWCGAWGVRARLKFGEIDGYNPLYHILSNLHEEF